MFTSGWKILTLFREKNAINPCFGATRLDWWAKKAFETN